MRQDVAHETISTNDDEKALINWLILSQIPRFGVSRWLKFYSKFNINLAELLSSSAETLDEFGFNQQQISAITTPNRQLIDKSLQWFYDKEQRFLIHFAHSKYPYLLKQIPSAPPVLFGYGRCDLLSSYQLSMVGSRNPTPQGKESAKRFAHLLCESGWIVTSGLAMGIDGLSHQGALIGERSTIAVLGTAIDKMYPRRHIKLAEQILEHDGVIISEFAPGSLSRPENFPRRNRIISGLSLGVLVVEAAIKSGSLITARYALEQNREVLAIPGNIQNPLAAGCNLLIQQGAKLVTCIEDILEEFPQVNDLLANSNEDKLKKKSFQSLASDKLLDSVDFEVTPLDIVAQRSGIEVTEVMSKLLEFELRGLVTSVPGGYIKLGEK
ncbi:DNA-processing protein DprA [uncultured Paraglaciecola sp.]|uniref:DNA-processing protein DprA n=1 Tax=uncultured Paraglaciecola sp. TaxID=1765024 RepID=UPI0025933566|nr:DNA-processing protein DprA [uncultured Paraglaciecola sp.]